MAKRNTAPKWVQEAMPKRCCFCGSTENIEYDHINPAVLDETGNPAWTIENTRPLCHKCHHEYSHGQKVDGQMEMLRNHAFLVRIGIEKAKKNGKRLGRPDKADEEEIMQRIAENDSQFNDFKKNPDFPLYTRDELIAMMGWKTTTYFKCKRKLIEAMEAEVWPYEWDKPAINNGKPIDSRIIKRMKKESKEWKQRNSR